MAGAVQQNAAQPVEAEAGGKRDAILDAALHLFAERGFHGTPVPMVAERAGVGAGTIYRYFESKEALVNAVYQKWKSELCRALLEGFPVEAPVRQQFHWMWQQLAGYVRRHPQAFAFMELHHHAPYLDARSRAIEEELLGVLEAYVQETTRREVTKELSPRLLLACVYGIFAAIVKGSWLGHLDLTPQTLDAAEACAWEAIRR